MTTANSVVGILRSSFGFVYKDGGHVWPRKTRLPSNSLSRKDITTSESSSVFHVFMLTLGTHQRIHRTANNSKRGDSHEMLPFLGDAGPQKCLPAPSLKIDLSYCPSTAALPTWLQCCQKLGARNSMQICYVNGRNMANMLIPADSQGPH